MRPLLLAQVFICAFFAIAFLQSGIDKVIDWRGNLTWLTGHFSKSPLRSFVHLMLGMITVFEIASGLTTAIGGTLLLLHRGSNWATMGLSFCCLSLLMLFFGQRLAKDYAGAATLATYFIIAVFGLFLLS